MSLIEYRLRGASIKVEGFAICHVGATMVGAGETICILAFLEALKTHFFCSLKGKTRALDNQYMNVFIE